MSLMCFSMCFLSSCYSDLCLEKGDTNTEKWSTWGKSGTLHLKVEIITYALGMSLKNPKHAYLTIPSPQNITDKINYSFANIYFTSKTSMTQALMLEKLFLRYPALTMPSVEVCTSVLKLFRSVLQHELNKQWLTRNTYSQCMFSS